MVYPETEDEVKEFQKVIHDFPFDFDKWEVQDKKVEGMDNQPKRSITHFKGEHSKSVLKETYVNGVLNGKCILIIDAVTSLTWKCKNGRKYGEYKLKYKNGIYYGLWDDLVERNITAHKIHKIPTGIEMIITDVSTGQMIYRGGCSADYERREGWGYQYDSYDGSLIRCGYFLNDKCVFVYQVFDGDMVTTYQFNTCEGIGNRQILSKGHALYNPATDLYEMVE